MHAWEHWDRVKEMDNPLGYLYRVAQSRSRRHRRPLGLVAGAAPPAERLVEPKLPAALAGLSDHQRVAVVLIHGYGCTYHEVADILDVSISTVQNHLERGLAKLRRQLGVELCNE
jgi:RNA polymerase sigma factor (sigma-70 family)